ncbi:MAG: primosomal protein N' [Nitrosomonas sp.]|nr:MAG: primosomal protein N' [Nitrosomonas sp.]
MPIIRVALNIPVDTLFDYQSDDASESDIGFRVCVPFGKKRVTGIIFAVTAATQISPGKLKSAYCIYREIKPLSSTLLDLFLFCSHYYHHPLGMVSINSLPARLRNNKPVNLKPSQSEQQYSLTMIGRQLDLRDIPVRQRIARRLLIEFQQATVLTGQQIKQISPRSHKILGQWQQMGWLAVTPVISPVSMTVSSSHKTIPTPMLTAEQDAAINTIKAHLKQFDIWLLQGVTGSGKTEVYLHVIDAALSHQKQALILVPEISLTPQLENIFRTRFPAASLVSLHSSLNDTERLLGWLQAQRGEAQIILGTRLAVFTPLPALGLIIVDEEHDSSFKQQDGLRYSARDLAVFRARQMNIPVILGSATPSLESYYNALSGRYRSVRLQSRAIKNAALPAIQCIDVRRHKTQEGLSQPLIEAIQHCLDEKHQSLVFINRRGYAPVLLCKSCGWTAVCQRCSSRLVVHLRAKKLCCHHCGYEGQVPRSCLRCGNQDIAPFGQGTQRVEESLAHYFPDARILRIDRDSTRRKHAWKEILQAVHEQQVDILVGTQLLAKGHDFPNLSVVAILNADNSLYSTDFRATERLFAQLIQVSGRAGRAHVSGHVLIQTEFPDHPLYRALQAHNYDGWAQNLLAERKIAAFPPFVYQALLCAEAHNRQLTLDFLTHAAKLATPSKGITLFDPVPAQMPRLRGLERAHLLIQSASRKHLQAFLSNWCIKISTLQNQKVRWILDVDPLEF